MTSLRKRLDNVLSELDTIRKALNESSKYPACCLIFHSDGRMSCDVNGPLEKEEFLKKCKKCRATIKEIVDSTLLKEKD